MLLSAFLFSFSHSYYIFIVANDEKERRPAWRECPAEDFYKYVIPFELDGTCKVCTVFLCYYSAYRGVIWGRDLVIATQQNYYIFGLLLLFLVCLGLSSSSTKSLQRSSSQARNVSTTTPKYFLHEMYFVFEVLDISNVRYLISILNSAQRKSKFSFFFFLFSKAR